MSDVDLNQIRPPQPLWPVRKVEKQPQDKHEDEQQRRRRKRDDDEDPLVDTFA